MCRVFTPGMVCYAMHKVRVYAENNQRIITERKTVSSVEEFWYKKTAAVPIGYRLMATIFRILAFLRRVSFTWLFFRTYRSPVPVIVVGNITVGGSGKTPVVVWLVNLLKKHDFKPGIVSRGYGGKADSWPQQVRPDSDPNVVGDEAILLARRSNCPMAVGPNRPAAVKALLQHTDVDIIISDDGMQHYALERDIEIAVIDGQRRFGNGLFLPAGPLREPLSRLRKVDFRINNGGKLEPYEMPMNLQMNRVINVCKPSVTKNIEDFKGKSVHAVAGIGNPGRFFDQLIRQGITLIKHPFSDHHLFAKEDVLFKDEMPVLMTQKDAVKCERFDNKNLWYVSVSAIMKPELEKGIIEMVNKVRINARGKHGC